MQSSKSQLAAPRFSRALRPERATEHRMALALAVLMSFATMTVLATTSVLSRHHAEEIAVTLSR
jgi:hypothetical protein